MGTIDPKMMANIVAAINTAKHTNASSNLQWSVEILTPPQIVFSDSHALKVRNAGIDGVTLVNNPKGSGEIAAPSQLFFSDSPALKVQKGCIDGLILVNNPKGDLPANFIRSGMSFTDMISYGNSKELQAGEKVPQAQEKLEKPPSTTSVIELSDEDSEDQDPKTEDGNARESPYDVIWHYIDPQGLMQGPFPLCSLKRWSEANYFHPCFMVWKSGQSLEDGVPLVDVLRQNSPDLIQFVDAVKAQNARTWS